MLVSFGAKTPFPGARAILIRCVCAGLFFFFFLGETSKKCNPDLFNVLCSDKQKTVLRPGFPGAGSQSPERLSSGLQSAVWLRKSQASLYSYCGLFIDYFHQQEQEAQSLTAENWGTMGRWAAPWWGPCGLWDGGGRLHGSVWG